MSRLRLPRWTIRLRLTLLYAGLFLASGIILLGTIDFLVGNTLPSSGAAKNPAAAAFADPRFRATCKQALGETSADSNLVEKCKAAFAAGVQFGANTQTNRAISSLLLFSALALAVMTVVSGGLGWVVAGRVLRPVHDITEAARRASAQRLGERLALRGPDDELRELADTFDAMLDRLDGAFAAQRRFAANASHELRTPLTAMRTAIEVTLAKRRPTAPQWESMAGDVLVEIDRAEVLIDRLLTLMRSDHLPRAADVTDLSGAVATSLAVRKRPITSAHLIVEAKLDSSPAVGDRLLLETLVGNLVDNAVRHNVEGGWIRIATWTDNGTAFLDVANGGPVIEAPEALFEPFRRVDERTFGVGGFGLGLSIVQAIARAHGGEVNATGPPEGGLAVRVSLPRAEIQAA